MITATPKRVPVRLLAWDSATFDVTVQAVASGRVRVLHLDDLTATEGAKELVAALARAKRHEVEVA
jgi:hypothetical protein